MSEMYSNCECGEEGVWFADNNASGEIEWYCAECEDNRSMKYGCAMVLSEGAMCQDGACGCDGKGVYK